MKRGLRPLLPYEPDESFVSWIHRLARFHTKGPAAEFLADLGMSFVEIARGDLSRASQLCDLTGQCSEPIRLNGLLSGGVRGRLLHDQLISLGQLTGRSTRFCPHCLLEDVLAGRGMRLRSLWMVKPVMCCSVHGVLLATHRYPTGGAATHDLFQIAGPGSGDLKAKADRAVSASPSLLQQYLETRLSPQREGIWLDEIEVDDVVNGVETIGVTLMFGPSASRQSLSPADLIAATDVAWPYVASGEDGLLAAFSEMKGSGDVAGFGVHRRRHGSYGQVYEWCKRVAAGKGENCFSKAMRRHIVENDDVAPGEVILGEVVRSPTHSSSASLARGTGLSRADIDEYLRTVVSEHHSASDLLCRTTCERIISDLTAALPRREAYRILGVEMTVGDALVNTGALRLVQSWRFNEDQVDAKSVTELLEFVDKATDAVNVVPDGLVELGRVLSQLEYPIDIFVAGLRRGFVKGFNQRGRRISLGTMLVDRELIFSLPHQMPAELTGYWF